MIDKLLIVGAGGHAKVIIDIFNESNKYDIIGLLDNYSHKGIMGIPVIGKDEDAIRFLKAGITKAFIAIGDNRIRKRISEQMQQYGYTFVNAISSNAIISRYVKLGKGIAIMPGAIINVDAVIGNGTIINTGATIDHECSIARYVHIAPGSTLSGRVVVGEGSLLGTGTKVIDKIKIGSWTTIGGGAAVINDIGSNCIAVGVPAKVIKKE